jgi:trans-aconitate 2-methyltransferase
MPTAIHQWNPADYARHSQGQERWARELLTLMSLRPDESVLDVGCGDGRHTAEIASLVPEGRVVGIDRSPQMIAFAKERFPSAEFQNLRFVQADACALPFTSEFDVVFSNAVLHWLRDHQPVLGGTAGSLRPGGRCVLQMGGKGNGADVIQALNHCLNDPKCQAAPHSPEIPYGFYDSAEYRIWLQESGLVPDAVELIEKDMVHLSREAFTGWLRTAWLPYTERVPIEHRAAFLEAVTDQYLKQHPRDPGGQVHVKMIRLQVLAHKPIAGSSH